MPPTYASTVLTMPNVSTASARSLLPDVPAAPLVVVEIRATSSASTESAHRLILSALVKLAKAPDSVVTEATARNLESAPATQHITSFAITMESTDSTATVRLASTAQATLESAPDTPDKPRIAPRMSVSRDSTATTVRMRTETT